MVGGERWFGLPSAAGCSSANLWLGQKKCGGWRGGHRRIVKRSHDFKRNTPQLAADGINYRPSFIYDFWILNWIGIRFILNKFSYDMRREIGEGFFHLLLIIFNAFIWEGRLASGVFLWIWALAHWLSLWKMIHKNLILLRRCLGMFDNKKQKQNEKRPLSEGELQENKGWSNYSEFPISCRAFQKATSRKQRLKQLSGDSG